jgi:molybdenum cofactor biosynthesis enzyme MoaA
MEDPSQNAADVAVPPSGSLPSSVCLRVTRACNARCGFCLAPPTGHGVTYMSIQRRLRWLAAEGVHKVHLCGGEPTIRRDLPEIIRDVRECGLVCAMTTNGILLSPVVLEQLRIADAKVKVSVHGPKALHESILRRNCYEQVDRNLARLLEAGVTTGIQTVVTRRLPDVHNWMIDYCLQRGIRKLRLLPFVPRGRGLQAADLYQLSPEQHEHLETSVSEARRQLEGRLDVDILDFWIQDYYVLETDGQLQIQRETDTADSTIAHVA